MAVIRVVTNDTVKENIGKVALQRGPIVYCGEWVDNASGVDNIVIPANTHFNSEFKPELLNGITILKADVSKIELNSNENQVSTATKPFVAIPYYAWANRGKGDMMIWFPEKIKHVEIKSN